MLANLMLALTGPAAATLASGGTAVMTVVLLRAAVVEVAAVRAVARVHRPLDGVEDVICCWGHQRCHPGHQLREAKSKAMGQQQQKR
mmetsp:Transcript_58246/g.115450  ORF Transcript_58246/g.115450 Transcript_58246/m.115450 type:complete len:87 (-) Transcript_58246:16-276(-)